MGENEKAIAPGIPGPGLKPEKIREEMINFMADELGWKVKGDNPFLAQGFALMFEHFTKLIVANNKVDIIYDGDKKAQGNFS